MSSSISAFSSLETFSPSACRATVMISFSSSRQALIRALRFLSSNGFVIFLYLIVLEIGASSTEWISGVVLDTCLVPIGEKYVFIFSLRFMVTCVYITLLLSQSRIWVTFHSVRSLGLLLLRLVSQNHSVFVSLTATSPFPIFYSSCITALLRLSLESINCFVSDLSRNAPSCIYKPLRHRSVTLNCSVSVLYLCTAPSRTSRLFPASLVYSWTVTA